MMLEINSNEPVRPTVIRQPMGWPEAMTKIAFYATVAVCMAGWPKIVKQVKAKMEDSPTPEDKDEKKEKGK